MNAHDGSVGRSRRTVVRDREDLVIAQLHRLAPELDGEPDPAFRAAARARLVAMAAVRTPAPAPQSGLKRLLAARAADARPPRWRTRLTAGLAGAALTVTALASLVAVADGAQPGDALYGLKRGTEQTQLALAGDSRGQTLLEFAGTRLTELEALVDDSATALPAAAPADGTAPAADADPAPMLETLSTMDAQTTEGTVWLTDRAVAAEDSQPLDLLSSWAAQQSAGLAALQTLVPDSTSDAVADSLVLLSDVVTRVEGLQSSIDCPAGPAVNGSDDLGPVPGLCVPAPAAPPVTGTPETTTGTPPGTGSAPQPPAQTLPTAPPVPGTTDGPPLPGGPTPPSVSVPSTLPAPGGVLPSLPVPVPVPTLPATDGSIVEVPLPEPPVSVCLPPLATFGDC